ncbi:alpha-ketoacid dehydrogenase subunit beta [Candidatus Atribacteria bacterium HGW-Atribacteria-1]|nr:MAG: alpha-ketoacid dehydrogenase subunit beta [Candidatus Atribacteria bacterium HGW-Atribacteria-1]
MTKKITYAQAICEAIDEEMARDKNVLILGEDVGVLGGNFKTAVGLQEKYGDLRVKDTPISENSFLGMSLGMALTGLRPIVEIMFSDFLLLAADQLLNQIAKIRYMSGGQVKVPLTVRTTIGAGRSSAAQHSQSLHAIMCHIPGLKIVIPSSAAEAKGLLKTAIREDNPVVFIEHKMEYNKIYEIPEGEYTIPLGKANVLREGSDITVIATSNLALKAVKVADELAKEGIEIEVIDPRTLIPLDRDTLIASVKKTGKVLITDEGYERCNIAAEIVMDLMPDIFYYLDNPPERLCLPNFPLPFSPALEFPLIPDQQKLYKKIKKIFEG